MKDDLEKYLELIGDIMHDRKEKQTSYINDVESFTERKEAYEKGYQAFKEGKSMSEVPYSEEGYGVLFDNWCEGYMDAEEGY